jgi:hypothetical protein
MPDPQKSVEMAFQMSFGSRNWSDVLEYVLDTNAYLEKQFLQIFHQQKRSFVGAARSRVEKRIFSAYHLLQDVKSSDELSEGRKTAAYWNGTFVTQTIGMSHERNEKDKFI